MFKKLQSVESIIICQSRIIGPIRDSSSRLAILGLRESGRLSRLSHQNIGRKETHDPGDSDSQEQEMHIVPADSPSR